MPITNWNNNATISGPCATNDLSDSCITTRIVSPIIGADVIITLHNVTIDSPNIFINSGTNWATPNIIAWIPATIVVTPPVKAAANAAIPAASFNTPALNIHIPAPNKAIAAETANITGTAPPNNLAATRTITNAPPNAIKLIISPPTFNVANNFIAVANINIPVASPIIADIPFNDPPLALNNLVNINISANAPPIATNEVLTCSHDIFPKSFNIKPKNPRPNAIIFKAFTLAFNCFKFFGNAYTNLTNIAKAPPITPSAVNMFGHPILANIFNAAPNNINENAIFNILAILSLPFLYVGIFWIALVININPVVIPSNATPICLISMVPIIFNATARTTRLVANLRIAFADIVKSA